MNIFERWLKRPNKDQNLTKREENHVGVVSIPQDLVIPEGWFVFEMGQSIVHMLWFCQLVNFDDLMNKVPNPRRIWTEEHDTLQEALQECIQRLAKETQNETVDGRA